MYFARGIRDLLLTTQVSIDFYESLGDFQIHFIEMCFKQSIDEKMGLMSEIEQYNFHLFNEFKSSRFECIDYGQESNHDKKVA